MALPCILVISLYLTFSLLFLLLNQLFCHLTYPTNLIERQTSRWTGRVTERERERERDLESYID
jgi:hypothetical protein